MSLHNDALKLYYDGEHAGAIEMFKLALEEDPSPGLRMVIEMHLALAIWTQAGLELEGKVYSIDERNVTAAQEAMHIWEDVINIYHNEVANNPQELRQWPLPGATALELKKDAASAAWRAFAAIDRVKGGQMTRDLVYSKKKDR